MSDAKFTSMYVDLMRIINKDLEPLKDVTTGKPVTFRGLCLNKCQVRLLRVLSLRSF